MKLFAEWFNVAAIRRDNRNLRRTLRQRAEVENAATAEVATLRAKVAELEASLRVAGAENESLWELNERNTARIRSERAAHQRRQAGREHRPDLADAENDAA